MAKSRTRKGGGVKKQRMKRSDLNSWMWIAGAVVVLLIVLVLVVPGFREKIGVRRPTIIACHLPDESCLMTSHEKCLGDLTRLKVPQPTKIDFRNRQKLDDPSGAIVRRGGVPVPATKEEIDNYRKGINQCGSANERYVVGHSTTPRGGGKLPDLQDECKADFNKQARAVCDKGDFEIINSGGTPIFPGIKEPPLNPVNDKLICIGVVRCLSPTPIPVEPTAPVNPAPLENSAPSGAGTPPTTTFGSLTPSR